MSRRIGVLTTGPDLVIRSWDGVLERMTGRVASEVCGQPLELVVPRAAVPGIADLLQATLVSGGATVLAPAIHHYLIPCPPEGDQTGFPLMQQRVVVTALTNERGTAGLAIAIEDVTERVARERQLARRLKSGECAEAATGDGASRPAIDLLAAGVADADWKVRQSAITGLSRGDTPGLLAALVEALRHGHRDFSLLSSALRLLSLTELDAADALVSLLDEPDPDLRLQVALALGRQKGPSVVPALLRALDDPDPNVRFHAIESLGVQRAAAAVAPLGHVVTGDDFYLAFPALEALVQIGDPAAAVHITPRLTHPILGAAAADALGALGDEGVVAPLTAALEREGAPVAAIAGALTAVHARYEETAGAGGHIEDLTRRTLSSGGASRLLEQVSRASGTDLRSLLVVLSWTRLPHVGEALTRLLGDASIHHEVIETLVRFGSPVVDLLVTQFERGDAQARRAAAVALGRIGDRRAVPALVTALLASDRDLLVPVAGALARLGDAAAFEPLLALLDDADPTVRQAAIGALNSIGHPGMADRVHDLLESPDRNVRESAVKIAGYFGYDRCADRLLARVDDRDERVRAAALEHVAYLDDPRVRPALARALADANPRCRAAAAASLGFVPDGQPDLVRALDDEDQWVRYFAVRSLGRVGDADAIEPLAARASGDRSSPVRIAAIDALGVLGGDRAVARLTPLVTEDDDTIAVAALRALGSLCRDDVAPILLAALRSPRSARREAAAMAMAQSGHAEAVEALRLAASADDDGRVASAALAGLGVLASQRGAVDLARRAVEALVTVAADGAGGERRAEALARIASAPESVVTTLAGLLEAEEQPLRLAAVEALGRVARPSASSLLVQALDDRDPHIRERALSILMRLGTRGAGRRLAQMAHADDSPAVRRAARLALERAGGADADGNS